MKNFIVLFSFFSFLKGQNISYDNIITIKDILKDWSKKFIDIKKIDIRAIMRILIKSKNLSKSTVPKIIDLGILYVFDKKIHFKNSPALKGNVLLPKYPII